MKIKYDKLVRDNIPEKIEKNNEIAVTKILNDEEYKSELYKKLLEETNEVINSSTSNELSEELSDVLEVIIAISKLNNISLDDIKESNLAVLKREYI